MKKKTILFLLLVLLFLVSQTIYLQGEEKEGITVLAFTSGNTYLGSTENDKSFYVRGLADMLFCEVYKYRSELYSYLEIKTEDMTVGQIKAIFDKYLEEHPEDWHLAAASLFNSAINELLWGGMMD